MGKRNRMIGALASICVMILVSSFTVCAKGNYYGRTVAEGETYEESEYTLYGYYDGCTFTNNGTVNITGGFGLINLGKSADFFNHGTFTFQSPGIESSESFEVDGGCSFVNKGTAKIDGCYAFLIQGELINEGTLFLSNIKNATPDGIKNTGTIVYDEDTVVPSLINALRDKMSGEGSLLTKEQYDKSPGQEIKNEITYDLNGGRWKEEPDEAIYSYHSNSQGYSVVGVDPPYDRVNENAVREHYRLDGWTCENRGITEPDRNLIIFGNWTGETALKAMWSPSPYYIFYRLEGGSFPEGIAGPDISGDASPYTLFNIESDTFTLPVPVKSGYTFKGWVRGGAPATDVQKEVTVPKGTAGNVTYTAQWEADGNTPYTVKIYYMDEEGKYNTDPHITREEKGKTDAQAEISPAAYAKQGFSLDTAKSTGSGTITADGKLVLSLYYQRDQHIVTFKSYDGKTVISSEEYYYGTPVVCPEPPAYTQEGYTFTFRGWDSGPESSYGSTSLGAVREDKTYYAAYKKEANFCTVTFKKLEGVKAPGADTVKLGKGEPFTVTFTLENEKYYVGTKEWTYTYKELGVVFSDGPGGLMQDDGYTLTVSEDCRSVVLEIPKVERNLDITFCAGYHEQHDYSERFDTVLKEATCTEKGLVRHFCYKCGKTSEEESGPDVSNHKKLVKTEARPATYDEEGNIEYYSCGGCKKYFRDAAGQEEISYQDTVIGKLNKDSGTDTPDPDNPDNPKPGTPDPDNPKPGTPDPDNPGAESPDPVVNGDPAKASLNIINAKAVQSGAGINISWRRIDNAERYDIYAGKCGGRMKLAGSVKGKNKASLTVKKINGRRINSRSSYKIQVKAYRIVNGKKKLAAKSFILHIAGKGNRTYTNARSIKAAKTAITMKKGKSQKLQAKVVKESFAKKLLPKSHTAPLRYYSSNEAIASVSESGIIRGKRSGACTVYAVAANGIRRGFKVTVR